tara:strand:- start:358 stop:807 length:450 start_codon:yes stop_codon:yes gene_type:complete
MMMTNKTNNTAGYSGTALAKKLGIKAGYKIKVVNAPKEYSSFFSDLPHDLEWISAGQEKKNLIHYFAENNKQLEKDIVVLKNEIITNGVIWISWPKKASKVPTDLNGNIVRSIGLKNGLVDIKVCAVSDIWSGLKFVIPTKHRTQHGLI